MTYKKPKIKKDSIGEKINLFILRLSKVSLKERLFFTRHLEVMLKAGIPLLSALRTLSKQTKHKYFSYLLDDVSNQVEQGSTLTDSLRPYKKVFGELYINMIESGELSGKLEEILDRLYLQTKKQHELISKIKGALTYPTIIIIAMLGISIFMIAFIIPKITGIFKDYDAILPLPTRMLIFVSDAVVHNGQLTAIIAIALVLIIVKILKTKRGLYIFQGILLNLPIISPIIKQVNLASFSRTISSLLKTDIMIIKSFQITANVLGNLHYRKAILEIAEKIKEGEQINNVVKDYPKLFSPIIIQMITVGEQTGELDNILEELANFYEDEVDKTMEILPAIIEPVLILVLGCGVGAVAVAIIMPMYSLTTTL